MDFSNDELEASRRRLGVPADWEWHLCANGCGDVVWVAPGSLTQQPGGPPIKPVCSARCAHELVRNSDR